MLGFQILESEKLKPNTSKLYSPDELYDLITYNTSDVVNLAQLFHHKLYTGQFTLKKELLKNIQNLFIPKSKTLMSQIFRRRLLIDKGCALIHHQHNL